jgi:tetratricopeptide (TPR) repeat protein
MTATVTLDESAPFSWRRCLLRRRNAIINDSSSKTLYNRHSSSTLTAATTHDDEASLSSLESSMREVHITESALHQESSSSLSTSAADDDVLQKNETKARDYFTRALNLAERSEQYRALDLIEAGLALLPDTACDTLYISLQEWRAHLLGQMQHYTECLAVYQTLLSRTRNEASDEVRANWYFACARLSIRLREYQKALDYYQEELTCTSLSTPSMLLAMSRICHDSAKVAHKALGDLPLALNYYQEALKAEHEYLKLADVGAEEHERMRRVLLETQRCMGRIHFEMGNVDQAIAMSMR